MNANRFTPGQERLIRHNALTLQAKADKITAFRQRNSRYLGGAIGLSKPGWLSTLGTALMWKSDHDDGRHAKKAQKEMSKLTGKIEYLSNGHKLDPKADKELYWSLTGGILIRSALRKEWGTTATVGATAIVTHWRDKKMAEQRQFVEDNDLDISVAAINTNRYKTAVLAMSETILVSPLSNNPAVKKIALGGLVGGTLLGVYGMLQYKEQVSCAFQQQEALRASFCPDDI